MKRIVPILLLFLLLVGCKGALSDEYVFVTEHVAPFAVKETTQETTEAPEEASMPVAACARDICLIIQKMICEGREEGQILLPQYGENSVSELSVEDLNNLIKTMRENDPLYVYAMHQDSFSYKLTQTGSDTVLSVSFKLRLTAQEVQNIQTDLFGNAMSKIYEALNEHRSSFTIQVSGYKDKDIAAMLDDYILQNPDQVVEAPEISVTVFPSNGGSMRVLDFLFAYKDNTPAVLQAHKIQTIRFLDVTQTQITAAKTAQETVDALYRQLVSPSGYENDPEATVYSLATKESSNSRVMASVVRYLCEKAGWNCEIIGGMLEGESWYWNRLLVEGQWLYFDLQSAGRKPEPDPPLLRSAEEMRGYAWDHERFPEAETPVQDPNGPSLTEPTQTQETATLPDPTEMPVISEGVAPTEPVSTEPTEPVSSAEEEPETTEIGTDVP